MEEIAIEAIKNKILNQIKLRLNSFYNKMALQNQKHRKSENYDFKKSIESYQAFYDYFNSEDPDWLRIAKLDTFFENHPMPNQILKVIVIDFMNILEKKKFSIPRAAQKRHDLLIYYIYQNANIFSPLFLNNNIIKYHNSNPQKISINDAGDFKTAIVNFVNHNDEKITKNFDINDDNLQTLLKGIKGLSNLVIMKYNQPNIYYIFAFSKLGKSTNDTCICALSNIECTSYDEINLVESEEKTVHNSNSIEENTNSSDEINLVEDAVKNSIINEDNTNSLSSDVNIAINNDGEPIQISSNTIEEKYDDNQQFDMLEFFSDTFDLDADSFF